MYYIPFHKNDHRFAETLEIEQVNSQTQPTDLQLAPSVERETTL